MEVRQRCGFTLINRDRQHEYRVAIAESPPVEMPGEPEELDPRSLAELESRLDEIGEQNGATSTAADRFYAFAQTIAPANWERSRTKRRGSSQNSVRSSMDRYLFFRDGRRGVNCGVGNLRAENTLALVSRSPDADEQPPTLLSNPRPIAGAEGAVTFFMTPGYRAWDPTWVMFFSFSAFFAMILADAGYGLVLGVILALFAKRLGRTAAGRQFRQLAVFMVSVTIVYGLMIGSFFGFTPPPGSGLDAR